MVTVELDVNMLCHRGLDESVTCAEIHDKYTGLNSDEEYQK